MTFSEITTGIGIRCTDCRKYIGVAGDSEIQQPKQLAKKFRWKHGKVKGSWVCPECQKYAPVQLE